MRRWNGPRQPTRSSCGGHALVAFAEVVASLGRPDEAAGAVAEAVALIGRKGNTRAAAASRRLAHLRG